MNVAVRAEDLMTPRNALQFRTCETDAEVLANLSGFDAVPISRHDGKVLDFWSRLERQRVRIRSRHRVPHDTHVESLLKPLGEHVVQFVYYRSEVVGLIDASDLNRPIARIAWLQPMLELERAILDAVRARGFSEEQQSTALRRHASIARGRQRRAKRQNLDLPLMEYAQFKDLLCAARTLEVIDLDDVTIESLNAVRKRAAHSGDLVVESRDDCARLAQALAIARTSVRRTRSFFGAKVGRAALTY
jgi:hypothetical protein